MKKEISILCIPFFLISCSVNLKTNNDFSYAKTTYLENGMEHSLDMQTLYRNSGYPHLASTSKNILVIPLGFNDENLVNIQTQENINKLTKAFNGDENENFQSVKSFYQKSSYGKVNLNADIISNWLIFDGTSKEFQQKYKQETLGLGACEYIKEKYEEEFSKENHGLLGVNAKDLSYYDQDNDGFVDFIWIIYSQTSDQIPSSDWWAYVSYTQNKFEKNNTQIQTFGFASIDWLNRNNGCDTHTYIHETGHAFGLVDYYDYNNYWSPLGKIDMMDSSIGDHNAFSKFTLGWLNPLVVDSTSEITLKSTSLYGSCFIIPSPNYNGTAFDEYMMIEFMAPIGLAQKDYTNGYDSVSGYSDYGVRISHIDARVVEKQSSEKEGYLTNIKDIYEKGKTIRITNSKGGRSNNVASSNFFPVEDSNGKVTAWNPYAESMIFESTFDPTDNITTSSTNSASNNSLFKKGARFSLEEGRTWVNYMPSRSNLWNKAKTMTSGTMPDKQKYTIDKDCKFNYRIRINDINVDSTNPENSTATITVEKIK